MPPMSTNINDNLHLQLVNNGDHLGFVNNPAEWRVWALSPTGARLREVPTSFKAATGTLLFTADVAADPAGATYLYEIVRQ